MANIGTFTRNSDGTFDGEVVMLGVEFKARLQPIPDHDAKGPHYRIYSGRAEIGAAWEKVGQTSGAEYISVTLDDPSFPNTVYASLHSNRVDSYDLIWSRRK